MGKKPKKIASDEESDEESGEVSDDMFDNMSDDEMDSEEVIAPRVGRTSKGECQLLLRLPCTSLF